MEQQQQQKPECNIKNLDYKRKLHIMENYMLDIYPISHLILQPWEMYIIKLYKQKKIKTQIIDLIF